MHDSLQISVKKNQKCVFDPVKKYNPCRKIWTELFLLQKCFLGVKTKLTHFILMFHLLKT